MQKAKTPTTETSVPVKLSLAECGKLLGFSYPTMLQLANRQDFPAFKVMGKWIIPYDQFIDWMEQQATAKAHE
ncbi:helix-turn-helix domain-containing protein [Eubacteriales bacterium OttesenSCG-928-A19]|nr:helix-turn-helix domain-containing protein [Eubacteriales bacterium OttesenSCG-928-A19]